MCTHRRRKDARVSRGATPEGKRCACMLLSFFCVCDECMPKHAVACSRQDDNIIVGIKKRLTQFKYNLSFIFEVYSNLRFAFPPLPSKLPASPGSCYMGRQLLGDRFLSAFAVLTDLLQPQEEP